MEVGQRPVIPGSDEGGLPREIIVLGSDSAIFILVFCSYVQLAFVVWKSLLFRWTKVCWAKKIYAAWQPWSFVTFADILFLFTAGDSRCQTVLSKFARFNRIETLGTWKSVEENAFLFDFSLRLFVLLEVLNWATRYDGNTVVLNGRRIEICLDV